MSLNNIQLPPIVINNLYNYYLVDVNSDKEITEIAKSGNLYLRGDNKNILLILNNIELPFVTANQLDFLSGILSACKLNLSDVSIINLSKIAEKEGSEFLKASKIIAFGIKASAIGLPFNIPEFQVQLFNNQTYIFAPDLDMIQNQAELKKKLWRSLKEVFSLKI